MKNKFFFLFIILFISSYFSNARNMQIDSIRVITTHYYTNTLIPVYCENMLRELEVVDNRLIVDANVINTFVVNLKKAKKYKANFEGIDTRAIVYMYYRDRTVRKLCISTTQVFSDNGKIRIFKTWDLHDFIFPVRLQKIQ